MINVVQVKKAGRRIIEYVCKDGRRKLHIDKEELSKLIAEGKVSNAKTQTYKGTIIVRVPEDVEVCQVEQKSNDVKASTKAKAVVKSAEKSKKAVTNIKKTKETVKNTKASKVNKGKKTRKSSKGIKGGLADIDRLGNDMGIVFESL